MKFRKKPVVIEATQWFKNGDHPEDGPGIEGKVVLFFNYSDVADAAAQCSSCSQSLRLHGRIGTLEGHHIVCPGDWIITGVKGERYPCKPDIFEATYEPVELEEEKKT